MLTPFNSLENSIATVFLLTLIPTLIWINLIRKRGDEERINVSKALFLGLLVAIPILAIQYLWLSPTDIEAHIHFKEPRTLILLSGIAAGALAEIAKFLILINLKWWKIKIKNIHQSILFMVTCALGFASVENVFYFLKVSENDDFTILYQNFIFRVLLVTAAHMIFSGITAYYYAIGKLGDPIVAMDDSIGKKNRIGKALKKIFNIKLSKTFQIEHLFIGIFLAVLFHAGFNSVLQTNQLPLAFLIVLIATLFVKHLSEKRISYLVFTPQENSQNAILSEKEQKKIIWLLGSWIKEKKYHQVISLCNRLLIKHPGNRLLAVIRARAKDRKHVQQLKQILKNLFSRTDKENHRPSEKYTDEDTRSIQTKYLPKKKNTLGLVLGGGGVRACLHLGFYQVLQENKIKVDFITGASGGAMIGSSLALGQDIELIKNKILAQRDLKFTWKDFKYFDNSLFKHDFLKTAIELLCEGKSFHDLKIPFACVAVDLESGQEIIFKDGALEPAIAASASLPMVFPPVYYRNRYLIDGGIKDSLPCSACRELGANKIIAISINSDIVRQRMAGDIFEKYHELKSVLKHEMKGGPIKRLLAKKRHDLTHFTNIIMQVLSISSECYYQEELTRSHPDLLVEVKCNVDLFEFNRMDEVIEIGRQAALKNLDKIKALLKEG